MVAMIATLFLTGCEKKPKTVVSFLDTLKADYENVVAQHDSAVVMFYEAQCQLTANVSDRADVTLEEYMDVIQCDSVVFTATRNVPAQTVVYDSVNGYWMEDLVVNLDTICDITVAIEALYKSDMVLPESNLVTLRRPLYKEDYNPLYIFGSTNTKYVAVDAVTLDVFVVE